MAVLWGLCLYIAVAYQLTMSSFFLTFLVFMIFAGAQSAFGYVLNDWGDRELDRRQFKFNAFNGLSSLERILALSLITIMAIVTGLPLAVRQGFAPLWAVWIGTAIAYSLEPLRLKSKGMAGLAVAFTAQWFLPVLLTFSAFEVGGRLDMWLIAAALTICGAALELGHQRWDRERDRITRAGTFAVNFAGRALDRLYALALLFDKLAVGVVVGVLAFHLARLGTQWSLALAAGLGAVYLVLFLATLKSSIRGLLAQGLDDPYYGSPTPFPSASQLLHQTLLNLVAPLAMGLAATVQDPLFAIPLGLFLVWRIVLSRADWRWPIRALRARRVKA